MQTKIGLDLGNYDLKTRNTVTPSSYAERTTKDLIAEESIFYNGLYYVPTLKRNNQQVDKTEGDYCLIMSLFGIAKELIARLNARFPGYNEAQLQDEISKYTEISLGVGLPAGKFSSLARKMVDCYMNAWKDGCEFSYINKSEGEFKFNFKLINCKPFPQDYTAVAFNKRVELPKGVNDYYIIGIGGGTVDIIPVNNTNVDTDQIMTFEKGTTVLYSQIIKRIQQETGKVMEYSTIESILRGENTIIRDERIDIIQREKADFAKKLVDEILHYGYQLSDRPCIFVGGGALLLKDALEANKEFAYTFFMDDVKANAYFFEALLAS